MNGPLTKLEKRLRLSGLLVVVGLLVELGSLHWAHPTAFLFFLLLGGTMMGLGMVVYLYSLVARGAE